MQIRVDVGHNPQAAGQLARALKAEASAGRTLAVYAALQDKDAAGVVQALQGVVGEWTLPAWTARVARVPQLQARLAETAAGSAQLAASVEQALAQVLAGRAR